MNEMRGTGMLGRECDFDKFRLRRFVETLVSLGEVEIHDEPVPLTGMSAIIERSGPKAVLFKQAGPERVEVAAKVGASRSRLIAAFGSTPQTIYDDYLGRFANPKKSFVVPSDEAPVHAVKITGNEVDLTKLPFHPQHEFDGSCYISSGIDYVIDPATGRSNVGSRRLSLRNRHEAGTNITAPSDLKRIFEACAKRRERLPISFTIGSHPLDFIAATSRQQGDEHHMLSTVRGEPTPLVKCLTNDILVPADAEVVLEGYLDERGYYEPEGPYGEYMGYYGAIHMDPVFRCTAVTMRKDPLYLTLQHGSAFVLDQTDSTCMTALNIEATAMRILKNVCREPIAVSSRPLSGGSGTLRISLKQHRPGEARNAMLAIFGAILRIKQVYAFDEDIDVTDDRQVEWAMGTRFQGDQDIVMVTGMMGMPMDPSLDGRRTGAKIGFDCTRPFGKGDQIVHTRCAAKVFDGTARFKTVEQALASGPMFYTHLVEAVGSSDGREIAVALDELRQRGKLGRDRDGRYHLSQASPGLTGSVGAFYHDPNQGT
ncbi:MAG TPA: UbiD family decarboxylase [Beijerinckiaceae bacterium]|nr:UbiD family decarboxylase [Beijerinckiaceae bacterium]